MREVLKAQSIDCEEAVDAEEGLVRLRRGREFDRMLVDWNMPGMSSPEMVARARQEGMGELKILMVTTAAESECIEMAMEAGADEFLMKPFGAEAFKEKLARMGLERVAE